MTTQSFFNYVTEQGYNSLKPLWNEYVSATGNGEPIFECIEELADTFEIEPLELARMVFFGNLQNWGDNVYLNGYGNLESCWGVESSPISVRDLAQWLEESNHEFYQECEQLELAQSEAEE